MFTVGQTAGAIVCASLNVINDNVVEANEESLTLMIVADDPPVTTVTANSATVVIRENDNDGTYLSYSYISLQRHKPDQILRGSYVCT